MTWAAAVLLFAEVSVAPYMSPDMLPGERFDPEEGWLVQSVTIDERSAIVYERPVVVLPAAITVGEIHKSQRRFVLRVDGEKREVGSHYFTAELLGTAALPGYADCLKIRRSSLRVDYSGQQIGYDVTEWYARGVGVVWTEGERFWRDADGQLTRTETID